LKASKTILDHKTFEKAAKSIFESCKNLLGATSGYIALLKEDATEPENKGKNKAENGDKSKAENDVLFLNSGGLSCSVDPSLPMPIRGLREVVYRLGETVYENNFNKSKWMKYIPEGHVELKNVLFSPLKLENRTVGLIGLANKPGGFDEDDKRIASVFGEFAAIALMNSRTYEMLEKSEKHFRSVAQTARDAVITLDSDGNIFYWNKGAERIFGFKSEEIVGKPVYKIIPEKFRAKHEKGLKELLNFKNEGLLKNSLELSGLRKDGNKISIEVSLSSWMAKGQKYFTAIVRDISERKKIEEELRDHQTKLNELIKERTSELLKANEQLKVEIQEKEKVQDRLIYIGRILRSIMLINRLIAEVRDQNLLLNGICEILSGIDEYSSITVSLFSKSKKQDFFYAGYKLRKEFMSMLRGKNFDYGSVKKPLILRNIQVKEAFEDLEKYVKNQSISEISVITLPIASGDKFFGFMTICSHEKNVFDGEELELLIHVCDDVASAIHGIEVEEEQSRVKGKLEELSRRNELILNSAGEGIYGIDLDGRTTFFNPAASSMTGYSKEEVIGKDQHKLLHHKKPDGKPYPREDCPTYMAIKYGFVYHIPEDTFWKKNGSPLPVEYVVSPLKDKNEILGAVVVFKDISKRKKMEEELRRLSLAVKISTDSIIITDKNGNIVDVNDATQKMVGMNRNALIGRNLSELVVDDARRKIKASIKELMKKGLLENQEYSIPGNRVIETNMSLMKDSQGRITGIVAINRDITERKHAELEMKRRLMKYELEDGSIYCEKESSLNRSLDAFEDLLKIGYSGLIISRTPREKFKTDIQLSFGYWWVNDKIKTEDCISPDKNEFEKRIEESVYRVILIDCIEYLVSKIGFDKVLLLIQRLRDMAFITGRIILISIDSSTFDEKQLRLIERETEELEARYFEEIPDELLNILKFVFQQNKRGISPSFSDIERELNITKPTVRKRVSKLSKYDYLITIIKGRSKLVELTDKGRNLFLK